MKLPFILNWQYDMVCGNFSLVGVDDDPVDSYGGPADDGGGEDDGHHDGHAVQASMVGLMCITVALDIVVDVKYEVECLWK